jgi:hypothetical protein
MTQAGLKLSVHRAQPPKYWDYKHVSPCLAPAEIFLTLLVPIHVKVQQGDTAEVDYLAVFKERIILHIFT